MNIEFMQSTGIEHLPAFLTSLAIGLLIGIERERSPAAKAGLRTFALVALFGTVSGLISEKTDSPWFLLGGLVIVGLMTVAAYLRENNPDSDPGTTTVAAIIMCYGLGAIVWFGYSTLAVMLAITTTILLYYKTELSGISKSLTRKDLISIFQFAILSFIILPILPDKNYGPYSALNPYQIWLMVVLISGISLSGYVALRLMGEKVGAPLLGFLGGLVSSTATTLAYARYQKEDDKVMQLAIVVILLANLVVLVRLSVMSAIVSPSIIPYILPVLGTGLALGLMSAIYWYRKLIGNGALPIPEVSNPTEIKTALTFGLVYAVVLFCAAWLSDLSGSRGLYVVALISGLTDVDAISLSSLRLYELGKLPPVNAVTSITLAILANSAFKLGLVFSIGGKELGRRCAGGMLATAVGLALALVVMRS